MTARPSRFERFRCEPDVARAPRSIENDAGDRHTIAKPLKTPSDRRSRLRLAGNIEHENDGPACRGGEVGAGAVAPASALRNAVEEAHQGLANDDICATRRLKQKLSREPPAHGPAVDVVGRTARGHRVKGWVDIIGAAFERLCVEPTPLQRPQQSQRHRRLAGARSRCRDHQARRQ